MRVLIIISNLITFEVTMISLLRYHCGHVLKPQVVSIQPGDIYSKTQEISIRYSKSFSKDIIWVLFISANEIKFEITVISPRRYRCGHVLKPQLNLMRFSTISLFDLILYHLDISFEILKRFLPGTELRRINSS